MTLKASKIRFQEQMVGRPINKIPPEFSGACFEMGLMRVKFEDEECFVTLSENGYELALLENPILDSDEYNRSFSNEEIQFIKEKIISKFNLENKLVNLIIRQLASKTFLAKEIEELFEKEKLQYYQDQISNKKIKRN